jgi:RES domain-containing protein
VHKGVVVPAERYKVMVISIADDDYLQQQIHKKDLPPDWRTLGAYSTLQKLGSEWIKSQESLVLKVPSAVVPYEYNFIINTEHLEFSSKVKLVRTEEYFWDSRLLSR